MRFEASFLNVQPGDGLACGIGWWVYDPEQGDGVRAFLGLGR